MAYYSLYTGGSSAANTYIPYEYHWDGTSEGYRLGEVIYEEDNKDEKKMSKEETLKEKINKIKEKRIEIQDKIIKILRNNEKELMDCDGLSFGFIEFLVKRYRFFNDKKQTKNFRKILCTIHITNILLFNYDAILELDGKIWLKYAEILGFIERNYEGYIREFYSEEIKQLDNSDKIICLRCGSYNPPNARYCNYCGCEF